MSDHSPGPWTADSERYVTHAAGEPVARVARSDERTERANVRLIATAPEMLELLREVSACTCGGTPDHGCFGQRAAALLARIDGKATLAEARAEQVATVEKVEGP